MFCEACREAYPLVDGIPLMISAAERSGSGRDTFDSIAELYDTTLPAHVTEHYLDKRIALLSQCLKTGPVLDVGGGTGMLAQRLIGKGYQVLGTDASLGMLRVYRSRTSTVLAGALAHALPFRSQAFQGVVCVAMLHHIARPEAVRASLSEMYRVVRQGGVLVIWDHNPANPYWPVLMRRVPQDSGEERLIPLAEIYSGLREAGAKSIEAFKMGFIPDFAPAVLLPFLRRLEGALERVPLVRRWAAHNVVVVRKD